MNLPNHCRPIQLGKHWFDAANATFVSCYDRTKYGYCVEICNCNDDMQNGSYDCLVPFCFTWSDVFHLIPLFWTCFSCFSSCFAQSHLLVSVARTQHSTFFIVAAVVSHEDVRIDSHVLGLFLICTFWTAGIGTCRSTLPQFWLQISTSCMTCWRQREATGGNWRQLDATSSTRWSVLIKAPLIVSFHVFSGLVWALAVFAERSAFAPLTSLYQGLSGSSFEVLNWALALHRIL